MVDGADEIDRVIFFFLAKYGPEGLEVVLIFILWNYSWVVGDVSDLFFALRIQNSCIRCKTMRNIITLKRGAELFFLCARFERFVPILSTLHRSFARGSTGGS